MTSKTQGWTLAWLTRPRSGHGHDQQNGRCQLPVADRGVTCRSQIKVWERRSCRDPEPGQGPGWYPSRSATGMMTTSGSDISAPEKPYEGTAMNTFKASPCSCNHRVTLPQSQT